MWIHIHHGDEGLKSLLKSICTLCHYLLIEPQPSRCYRNVNTRLRKLNLEQIDVSVNKLQMRCDIENEIEKEVYIFICRHFLASVSKDAEGIETLVKLKVDD